MVAPLEAALGSQLPAYALLSRDMNFLDQIDYRESNATNSPRTRREQPEVHRHQDPAFVFSSDQYRSKSTQQCWL